MDVAQLDQPNSWHVCGSLQKWSVDSYIDIIPATFFSTFLMSLSEEYVTDMKKKKKHKNIYTTTFSICFKLKAP